MKAEMRIEHLGDGSFVGFLDGEVCASGRDAVTVAKRLGKVWAERIAKASEEALR